MVDRKNPVIVVLHPGELGSRLGAILVAGGRRVTATLEGRGTRTRRLCHETGLEVGGSFADVVRRADVAFSVVPPSAALAVAEQYAAVGRDGRPGLYVDVNSVSPDTVTCIGRVVQEAGADFVDAAVLGSAARLPAQGALFLSGPQAGRVAALFEAPLRVRVVGDAVGQASALKSALAGLNKGLAALFFEVGVLAHESGLSAAFLEECAAYYPGLTAVVDRLAPTYPRHARRRAEEMAELEHTMETLGLTPRMARAARSVIAAAAASGWPDQDGWTTAGVLEELHRRGAFRAR